MVAKSWYYPATIDEYPTANQGCLLPDVVSANAPFKTLFSTPPKNATGYTHEEVLRLASPLDSKSPYTYDTLRSGSG